MASSLAWRRYFENNSRVLLEIPWHCGPELSLAEKDAIAKSLCEFQAGESSEGRHFLRYAQSYANRTGDQEYVCALRLFIAEEQRHARDLGRFLTLNNIPLVRTTFTDRIFRKLRHLFGGLEISIAVLITAEIIAKVYYAAIGNATQSVILQRLCEQILRDEKMHVQFQAEQLATLRKNRGLLGRKITMGFQRFLFLGTVLVVWVVHQKAIRRGEMRILNWWQKCWQEFNGALKAQVTLSSASALLVPHWPD